MKLSSRNIALVAVFAALYYVLSLVSPYVPAVGLPDLRIRLEALMASVFGLVLGPYLGALSAFLGAFVTWASPTVGMNPADAPFLLSPPINALVTGLIFYRKWKWAFALYSLLIAAFLVLPPSQPLTQFYYVPALVLWDKVIALLLIIPSVTFSQKFSNQKHLPILFFLLAFIGNQADNMWGADIFAVPFVYENIFQIPDVSIVRGLFTLSPLVYPAIRFIQAILAAIIAVPLVGALRKTEWMMKEESIIEQ